MTHRLLPMNGDRGPAKRMASFSIDAEEQARTRDARFRDRRVSERFEINASGGCLNCRDSQYPCVIVDVSLTGCCVRTETKFLPGNLANVEVVLPILGMVLRMVGTTQWITRQNLIGIRFLHANPRSKNQLAGLLTGLADQSAAEEVKAAIVASALSGTTALDVDIPDEWLRLPLAAPEMPKKNFAHPASAPSVEIWPPRRASGVMNRTSESWPAVLSLLTDGIRQKGAIVAISLESCTVQTAFPFVAGLYARVEVDFQMRGLPFLLSGVTEDVREKTLVDIRFLAMSCRKQEELAELLDELQEADKNPTK